MRNLKSTLKNRNGSALIPVLVVSMVMASLLSVWMIQMSNKSAANGAEWVTKENFRIGTELAKQAGLGYEVFVQNNPNPGTFSCPAHTTLSTNYPLHFCFPTGGSNSATGACADSALSNVKVCIQPITANDVRPTSGSVPEMPTFIAAYQPIVRISPWISRAEAAPTGAPSTIPAVANSTTAITCNAGNSNQPTTSDCKQCDNLNYACYQIAYCTVSDPTCANGATSMLKLGVMVKIN